MRSKDFMGRLEHQTIVEAIRAAEFETSGEIRIYVQRGEITGDPLEAARKTFTELRMHETKERNAVLIYIVPCSRQLAVVGDQAVHKKCGDALWQTVVARMTDHFKQEHFTEAMVGAIQELGAVLAAHFPAQPGGTNELPDEIIES